MEIDDWCEKAENIRVALGEEYWKMNIGVAYSKELIAELEKKNGAHARVFLENFKEPFSLLLDATESVASERTYDLYMKMHDIRKTELASSKHKFAGKPVTWSTWRQWASKASDSARKEVYDEFIELAPKVLLPTIKERFEKILEVYKEHGLDPLDAYCKDHRMSLSSLKSFLTHLRDGVRHEFERQWPHYSEEILQRKPEYWDDFYFMRNAIWHKLPDVKVDPIASILNTAKELGFDPSKIVIDKEDRPDKYASPFCSFVKIPTDVRISFKPENPINDLNSVFHEFGHALHASSMDPKKPYWTKYVTSNGLNETFSTLFEDLIHDKAFLRNKLGISDKDADEIIKRIRFTRLYAVAFYCANSLFRVETWEKKIPIDEWDSHYARHVKECMGIDVPGQYWQLHHILPESVMYVPSYLLAEVRAAEIAKHAAEDFGKHWWQEPASGIYILGLMQPGADSEAGTFEDISPKVFVEELTRR